MATKFQEFVPKSFLYFRNYQFSTFKKDLIAGITVGIVALPLAMAFAIASGVEPARGLYTAIVAGFIISLLGGSRIQIGGPTGAFVVIIYDIVQRTGYAGLCVSTMIAAVFLVLLGLFRIGSLIKFIPHSLITGFTTGIAVIIFSTQIKEFFGLQLAVPASFVDKWTAYFHALPTLDVFTFSVSFATLGIILFVRKVFPSIPWAVFAICFSTLLIAIFKLPVETIQSRFGEIPKSLPLPDFANFSIPAGMWKECLTDAITIAFLGGIESLLSAVIGDGMIGGRHRSNCELIAQGIANGGSILFGGIPATGAIARTATNVKSGAQTPMAGMIHSVTLFLIILFLSPIVSQIPLAALSAVLMMVAWNMSEMPHFIQILRGPIGDKLVLIVSFLLTIFVDITVAITVGMILASFIFMRQMSQVSKVTPISHLFEENNLEKKMPIHFPEDVQVYEIQGPFFFGTANLLRDSLQSTTALPKKFILRLKNVPMIDASGIHALKEFYHVCEKKKITLYLTEIQEHSRKDLEKFGLLKMIGENHILSSLKDAI
ncbi:MAG TPA: sulfate permease [Chlamydiales bacterium]|nr:sulfate permease [Chlamydiales bacterium]